MNKRNVLWVLIVLLGLMPGAATGHAATLPDGSVVAWGSEGYGVLAVPDGSDFTAIDTSFFHNLALKSDGTVVAWGDNADGKSSVPDGLSGVTAIAAGGFHNLVLKSDGTVVAWGANMWGQTSVPDGLSGVTAVDAGIEHSLALKSDGTVVAWGQNFHGQTNVPGGLSGVVAIAAGGYHNLALKSDGTVVAWGQNALGQGELPDSLQNGTVTVIAAGMYHNLVLTSEGTVVAWGNNYDGQTNVPEDLSDVVAIAGGAYHSLALKNDGTVVGWGESEEGQINVPEDLSDVIAIAAGAAHSLALKTGGTITTAPAITSQPESQAVDVGDDASFNAAASGEPAPTLQWQMSTDKGATWSEIDGATINPLTFTAEFVQDGNQYRAVFTNSAGSATSNPATLTVSKKSATVVLSNLTQTYDGQPKPVTVTTDPAELSVNLMFNGSPIVPTDVGSYGVVATIDDIIYGGSASDTLIIQPRAASVTPDAANKTYGDPDPEFTGTLDGFVERDNVTAVYSRTSGEAVGDYAISAVLSPASVLVNYVIIDNPAAFTITPRSVQVTADAKTKFVGEADPPLTYQINSGSLADGDDFSGALTREPGEDAGVYAIQQGTVALNGNYTLTYVGANFTIFAESPNNQPVADPGGPYLGAINTAIVFNGSASSDVDGDSLTYAWDFGDGGSAIDEMASHAYDATGIYDVCLVVNDNEDDSVPACTIAVIYDPSAGFVTGGGWILSPEGAYKPDPNLCGKATFGFVSKYKKGASVPDGNTEFQFEAGGFKFYSTAYEWLVVNRVGMNAQFKGSGMVNDALDPNGNLYKFMLWAGDGTGPNGLDTFRIRIWWEADDLEHDLYDNGVDQEISGGSIVVHSSKVKSASAEEMDGAPQQQHLYLPLISAD